MLYLIRHGQSQFNIDEKHFVEKYGKKQKYTEEFAKIKFDPKYFDSPLNQKGVQQAIECGKIMATKDIDLVLVTPIRRALMTCYNIFKNHKDKPKVIVEPFLRQVFESSCDISSLLPKSIEQMTQFDYSKVRDIDYWYIHTIEDPVYRQKLLESIEKAPEQQRNKHARQLFLDILKEVWAQRVVQIDEQKEKPKKPNIFMYLSNQKKLLKQYTKQYKNIAVVSHSENIKFYTGEDVENCEVVEMKFEEFFNQNQK